MISFQKILVPVDFGESSDKALATAVELAKQFQSTLVLIHTWEIPAYDYGAMNFSAVDLLTPIEDAAKGQLDSLLAEVRTKVPSTRAILTRGIAWREIVSAIEHERPDLVVMGTHGRRGVGRVVLGSVAEKIVRVSPVPVLTVRAAPGT